MDWGISSADRALRLHRRGQRFESVILHNCNDSEMNDGTDAMYEMETFETRIKEWMRYKPHSRYIIFFGGVAQLARASALHAEGHRFDSCHLHQKKTNSYGK